MYFLPLGSVWFGTTAEFRGFQKRQTKMVALYCNVWDHAEDSSSIINSRRCVEAVQRDLRELRTDAQGPHNLPGPFSKLINIMVFLKCSTLVVSLLVLCVTPTARAIQYPVGISTCHYQQWRVRVRSKSCWQWD